MWAALLRPSTHCGRDVAFYHGDFHQELREPGGTERIFGAKFARYRDWVLSFLQSGRSIDIGTATGLFPSLLKQAGFDAEGTSTARQCAVGRRALWHSDQGRWLGTDRSRAGFL